MRISMRMSGDGSFREPKGYATLPAWTPEMVVRCPTHNVDLSPIGPADIPGCGSSNVIWAGDVYDCLECGIFFSDYAADPPHRREEES